MNEDFIALTNNCLRMLERTDERMMDTAPWNKLFWHL